MAGTKAVAGESKSKINSEWCCVGQTTSSCASQQVPSQHLWPSQILQVHICNIAPPPPLRPSYWNTLWPVMWVWLFHGPRPRQTGCREPRGGKLDFKSRPSVPTVSSLCSTSQVSFPPFISPALLSSLPPGVPVSSRAALLRRSCARCWDACYVYTCRRKLLYWQSGLWAFVKVVGGGLPTLIKTAVLLFPWGNFKISC